MEDEIQVTTEAATESGEAQSAETTETTEVTQPASTEEGGEESTGQEADETATEEGEEDKGVKKLTASERIQQEIERRKVAESEAKQERERIATLERKLEEIAKNQPEKRPYADDATVHTVKRNVALAIKQIEDIRSEIAVSDEVDEGLADRLLDLEEYVAGARSALKADAEARAKYDKEQQSRTVQERELAQKVEAANRAVAVYCDEKKIPAEVQKQGEEWFMNKLNASPTLAMRHKDIFDRQGPVAAAMWTVDYVLENMGKEAQAAKDAKDKAKNNTVAGKTSSGGITVGGKAIRTWSDLQSLSGSDINKFYKENPKEFERLSNQHFK
jgi:hypothetical protein